MGNLKSNSIKSYKRFVYPFPEKREIRDLPFFVRDILKIIWETIKLSSWFAKVLYEQRKKRRNICHNWNWKKWRRVYSKLIFFPPPFSDLYSWMLDVYWILPCFIQRLVCSLWYINNVVFLIYSIDCRE